MKSPMRSTPGDAPRRPRTPSGALACLVVALGASCASYPVRTEGALSDFRRGHFDAAIEAYRDEDVTGSRFLSAAEAGTVALTAGRWNQARRYLDEAVEEVRELEDRALVSAEGLGEEIVSWGLNDSFKTYRGEGFERVYLHSTLGIVYLALGRPESARVEARRANQLLEREEELYETQYRAGGLGHFLSAVLYELEGELDEAYIDYRRLYDKDLGRDLAGPALLRLARRLHYQDAIDELEETYGSEEPPAFDSASIVVIGGVGLAPQKVERFLLLPTGDGVARWAVPTFQQRPQPVSGLRLLLDHGEASVRTAVLEDVGRVAHENLEDRIAWMAAKSAVRSAIKLELTERLEDKWDVAGRLFGDMVMLWTERADLRSWQALPDSWQAARLFVPAGTHHLTLEAIGGQSVDLGHYELVPGETAFVVARSVDQQLFVQTVGGLPVAPPDPPPSGIEASAPSPVALESPPSTLSLASETDPHEE